MKDYASLLGEETVAILLFHGIIRRQRHAVRNYTRKHLTAERFSDILNSLSARGTPVSMTEVASGRPLPPRAFAVTFDDGFENNYSIAAPILRSLKIPATFYVTTGFIESDIPSWTDMIEYALEMAPTATLSLKAVGGRYSTPDEKIAFMDRVRRLVKGDPTLEPYAYAREVWHQLGIDRMDPDPELDGKMRWTQLRELLRDPLFTIGGHGRTHRILAYLSPDELEDEVSGSIAALSRQLDLTVEHYSYPEGLNHCYSPEVIGALKHHGIRCSPTAIEGVSRAGDDPFHLRRVWADS